MAALCYRYPSALIDGVLLRRYKRFLADVQLDDGSVLTVHCANPGAMSTCSDPGIAVRISDSGNPKRKLPHSLEQVRPGRSWVCVNTARPNAVVEAAIQRRLIPGLADYASLRREVSDGAASRIDLLLEGDQGRCWVEVKNVTLKAGTVARFPDAVTERGLKHLRALGDLRAAGDRAVMLYFVGRADVRSFGPARDVDAAYAVGLERAVEAGVEVIPVRALVSRRGLGVGPVLPYDLGHA
jgi:sugar fermentation stimulation protein A